MSEDTEELEDAVKIFSMLSKLTINLRYEYRWPTADEGYYAGCPQVKELVVDLCLGANVISTSAIEVSND